MFGIELDPTQSNTFSGVHFILIGFDSVSQQKVGLKLVNGGGVDVCHYGPACTHVIVDNLVYDDPICVAARRDGKVLVTGLWVDHSFNEGVAVDPTSVMYRPLKGRDGIPGAKTLLVCLTGYQRQDRDDIMTMVRLMGANFSKPLVANKVTHLICYKFEGEKYELARKMKTIKLVNHRWLEDCLKAWEILPEADYDKSGYELEMMEAEAKDSEEEDAAQEPIPKQSEEIDIVASPNLTTVRARVSPQLTKNLSTPLRFSSASKGFPKVSNSDITVSASREESLSAKRLNIDERDTNVVSHQDPLDLQYVSYDQPYAKTPTSAKVGSNLAANSDGIKTCAKNYLGNTVSRNTIPALKRDIKSLSSFSKVDVDKFNTSDGFDRSSKLDVDKYNTSDGFDRCRVGTETGPGRSSPKEEATLYGKRKMDTSFGISKSPKINSDTKACNSGTPLACNSGVDKNASLSFPRTSPANKANASSSPKYSSPVNLTKENKYDFDPKSLFNSVSVLKEPRPSSIESVNLGLTFEHGLNNIMGKSENASTEAFNPQRQRNDAQVTSSKVKILGLDKSCSPTSDGFKGDDLDSFKGKNEDSLGKPVRKKTIAKRTWNSGCRPKVALRKAKNQKGSIYLNDAESSPMDKNHDCEKPKILPSNFNVDKTMVTETNNVEPLEKEHVDKMGDMDDETEAPEDKEEDEVQAVVGEEKVEETDEVNLVVEDRSESTVPSPIKADYKSLDPHYADDDGANIENVPSGGKNGLNESAIDKGCELEKPTKSLGKRKSVPSVSGKRKLKEKVVTEESEIKNCNRKMRLNEKESSPSPRTKAEETSSLEKVEKSKVVEKGESPVVNRKSVPLVSEKIKSKEGGSREESENKKNNEKIVQSKKKNCAVPIAKTKRVTPLKEAKGSTEVEKENRPLGVSDPNVGQRTAKAASNFEKTPAKTGPKAGVTDQDSLQRTLNMKSEPTCFLLTGHKLQRKEFQQVIKRLKGRVCRDSHKWSYQATHFINPEPLRRTEKFFAAAASGRWILKTDYLAACNQAGEFLSEEPYEWHKKCLSEDGAINLEAPRKWRLLRERTGHGALYGMRVIIYGECIAPSLETLKRVIKAGDGDTLATSPPYTRFLNSGVDYAIVSSGMPRVDMWVQEFIRNEIPCVVADYLVEYVCKPGYPLDKHVLYNTQSWAEKSFAKLQNMSKEVVLEKETSEDELSDDICCEICGSSGRGEVMLICGNESGSFGCGVGTHIDCCNPPLESVPDEDWFCPKCSDSKKSKGHSKITKKGRSLSKAN